MNSQAGRFWSFTSSVLRPAVVLTARAPLLLTTSSGGWNATECSQLTEAGSHIVVQNMRGDLEPQDLGHFGFNEQI